MRKLFLIFMLINLSVAFCAEENESSFGDNSGVFNSGFGQQKQISDAKFKKTVEMMKERALTKKQKKMREMVKPQAPACDETHLDNFANDNSDKIDLNNSHTVMIPTVVYDEFGKSLQPGYYKLTCRKESKDSYMLDLSRGADTLMSVKAYQTDTDLEQDTINFCDAKIIDNNRIRLMYGNIDLNLVGYVYFK